MAARRSTRFGVINKFTFTLPCVGRRLGNENCLKTQRMGCSMGTQDNEQQQLTYCTAYSLPGMINKNACQRVPLLKCTRVSVIKSALVRVLNSKRKLAPRRVSRRLRRLWRWTLCWGEETCVSVRVLIEEQKNKIKNQSLETPLTVYIINVPFIMLQ